MKVWKGSYAVKALKIEQICSWVSTTTIISRTGERMSLHCNSVKRVLRRGSVKYYVVPLLGIKRYNDS